jgi:hypothetical protein
MKAARMSVRRQGCYPFLMDRKQDEPCGLVADGELRLRAAAQPHVEAEVRARYARELAGADERARRRIESEIRAEVERRLAEEAPPHALY